MWSQMMGQAADAPIGIKLAVHHLRGQKGTVHYEVEVPQNATHIDLENEVRKKLSKFGQVSFELQWTNPEGETMEVTARTFNAMMAVAEKLVVMPRVPLSQSSESQTNMGESICGKAPLPQPPLIDVDCMIISQETGFGDGAVTTSRVPAPTARATPLTAGALGAHTAAQQQTINSTDRVAALMLAAEEPPAFNMQQSAASAPIPIKRINEISPNLSAGSFRLQCIINHVHHPSNRVLGLLTLQDAENSDFKITAKCFSRVLSDDLSKVIQAEVLLSGITVAAKDQTDWKFSYNNHPCVILAKEMNSPSFTVLRSKAEIEREREERKKQLEQKNQPSNKISTFPAASAPASVSNPQSSGSGLKPGSSSGASSAEVFNKPSTVKRTKFIPKSSAAPGLSMTAAGVASSAGSVAPPPSSSAPAARVVVSSSAALALPAVNREKVNNGAGPVTAEQIEKRSATLAPVHKEVAKNVKRIRGREVDSRCFFCRLDLEIPEGIALLKKRAALCEKQLGVRVQIDLDSDIDVRRAFGDRRKSNPERRPLCNRAIIDPFEDRAFLAHPRCAHICHQYQLGRAPSELERGRCCLCGENGAVTECYQHAECGKLFHTECAILFPDHCPMGHLADQQPIPSCRRHMWVDPCRAKQSDSDEDNDLLGVVNKKGEDKRLLFDSSKPKEMRDPDEDD